MDASLLLGFVLRWQGAADIFSNLLSIDNIIAIPEVTDLEIANALRKNLNLKLLSADSAENAIQFYQSLDLERYSHQSLLPRIWQLKQNMTAYDAAYVALAEAHNAELWTADQKFSRTPGPNIKIVYHQQLPPAP